MSEDLLIDRSPEQKRLRLEKLRAELAEFGYRIVPIETAFWEKKLARATA